jgi:AraC-like DNA-binding protein
LCEASCRLLPKTYSMFPELLTLLWFGVAGIGLFMLIFLLRHSRKLSYLFFWLFMFQNFVSLLVGALWASGYLVYLPHLLYAPATLHYFAGTTSYLFVKYSLRSKQGFSRWDLLLFLPFALHFLNLLPFYVLSGEAKREIFLGYLKNGFYPLQRKEGVYGTYILHMQLKVSLAIVFNVLQWWLIRRFFATASHRLRKLNRRLLRWIIFNSAIFTVFAVGLGITILFSDNKVLLFFITLVVAVTIVVNMGYILRYPRILRGLQFRYDEVLTPLPPVRPEGVSQQVPAALKAAPPLVTTPRPKEPEVPEGLLKTLIEYMDLHQPFLNPNLTVNQLAIHFNVHPQRISAVIKDAYGLTFPEFINSYRLQLLDELVMKASKREKYTLDSLSAMVGFGSRNSFYNSFRKLRKTSPGEYYRIKESGEIGSVA